MTIEQKSLEVLAVSEWPVTIKLLWGNGDVEDATWQPHKGVWQYTIINPGYQRYSVHHPGWTTLQLKTGELHRKVESATLMSVTTKAPTPLRTSLVFKTAWAHPAYAVQISVPAGGYRIVLSLDGEKWEEIRENLPGRAPSREWKEMDMGEEELPYPLKNKLEGLKKALQHLGIGMLKVTADFNVPKERIVIASQQWYSDNRHAGRMAWQRKLAIAPDGWPYIFTEGAVSPRLQYDGKSKDGLPRGDEMLWGLVPENYR